MVQLDTIDSCHLIQAWKPIHLVLRPNLLSIYKDKDETKLRHQINLSEVTVVARQKDPKRKMDHVFGLFSPSRNFHLSAPSEKDAQEWVQLIRSEARIDEEEEEMILMSPAQKTCQGFERHLKRDGLGSSSSEAEGLRRPSSSIAPENMHSARRPSHTLTSYSGNEHGSFSDFSDTTGVAAFQDSSLSLANTRIAEQSPLPAAPGENKPAMGCSFREVSGLVTTPDDERVVYHGWLYVLKSKRGVRQWKKLWVVLRPKALGLYKNEEVLYFHSLIMCFISDFVSNTMT